MEKIRTCLVVALALGGATLGCSSDEPESEYPQPAASVGDEATPQEAVSENTSPQPQAATESMTPTTTNPDATMENPTGAASPAVSASPEAASPAVAESLRDAQIVKIADLAHAGEVEQAKLAQTKAQNPRVKKFAQMMITQHTKAKQKGMQLTKSADIAPEESTAAGQLESESARTLDQLRTAEGASFDQAYMSAQVKQHQEVLNMLDTTLIPSAQNPKLKAELQTTRTMVEKHLTDAQEIHQSLASTSN